jgi:ribonuclease Z
MALLPLASTSLSAAPGPNEVVKDRYVYYPGTEVLDKKEVRVIACGTGMPDQRIAQASACFLFEFGNGEKMIFDLGTGSMRNLASLMIPYEYLDKILISHLHTDHWGELGAIWAGGWTSGRPGPLRVWGPSGQTADMGTSHAVKGFLMANNWDFQTRAYKISPVPGGIEVNEFDYRKENAVIYQDKGITVRSWPAIHAGDGPVSFGIEYEGMKLVYGGDTTPNLWFVKYAKDADFIIHEAFANPAEYVRMMGQPPQLSWRMCCEFHTSGQSMGKVMSAVNARHAVAYHHQEELGPSIERAIR